MANFLDEALPEHDPQETVFRLLLSVLEQTTTQTVPQAIANQSEIVQPSSSAASNGPWMPLTYFTLWMTRLMGLLPDIAHCTACGESLVPGEAIEIRAVVPVRVDDEVA